MLQYLEKESLQMLLRLLISWPWINQKGDCVGESQLITWDLLTQCFLQLVAERESEGSSSLPLRWKEPWNKDPSVSYRSGECARPAGVEIVPVQLLAKKQGPHSCNLRNLNSANNLNKHGRILSRASNLAQLTPWFFSSEILSREPRCNWPAELWVNKWMLFKVLKFVVIYYKAIENKYTLY